MIASRILVAADIRLLRDGLVHSLGQRTGVVVAAAASSAAEAVEHERRHTPDVVLIDAAMTGALGAIRAIITGGSRVRVIAFTVPSDSMALLAVAEAGAVGFVSREGSIEDILAAVEQAARGELACCPRMAATLLGRVTELARGEAPGGLRRLTAREREVIRLVDEGCSNKEISWRLGIELATVKNHVHNILEKLGCRSRSEAAARVRQRITPPADAYRSSRLTLL